MIKELELEAKERLKLSPGRPKKGTQISGEVYDDLEPNPQVYNFSLYDDFGDPNTGPHRTNAAPAKAKATTHTTTNKSTEKEKKKHEGEAAEQAAKLLGTNRDYVAKMKKLEDTTTPSRPAMLRGSPKGKQKSRVR